MKSGLNFSIGFRLLFVIHDTDRDLIELSLAIDNDSPLLKHGKLDIWIVRSTIGHFTAILITCV